MQQRIVVVSEHHGLSAAGRTQAEAEANLARKIALHAPEPVDVGEDMLQERLNAGRFGTLDYGQIQSPW